MSKGRKSDKELWERVKKTAVPLNKNAQREKSVLELHEKSDHAALSFEELFTGQSKPAIATTPIAKPWKPDTGLAKQQKTPSGYLPNILDDKTTRKIAKGRLSLEGHLDLHGMTQAQAHSALLRFLQNAYDQEKRTVLVITGKGRLGEGILRNAVPLWLEETRFSSLVSGYRESHAPHGGAGALYIRIRRKRADRK